MDWIFSHIDELQTMARAGARLSSCLTHVQDLSAAPAAADAGSSSNMPSHSGRSLP